MSNYRFTSVEDSEANALSMTVADGVAVVHLSGELDAAMAPSVFAQLADVGGDVELDCGGLTFMDSAGVHLFIELHRDRVGHGAKLTVVNAPRCVTRVLALTGIDALFEVRAVDVVA